MNEKIAADRMTDIIFKINKLEVEKATVTKRFNNEISALEKELQGVALEYKNPQPDLFHDAELGKVLFEAVKTKDSVQITTVIRQFEDHTMLIVVINPEDEEAKQYEQRFEKSYEAFEWLIFLNTQIAAFDPDESIVENEMFKALDFYLATAEHLIDEYRSLKELRRVYCESLIENGYNPNDLEGDLIIYATVGKTELRAESINAYKSISEGLFVHDGGFTRIMQFGEDVGSRIYSNYKIDSKTPEGAEFPYTKEVGLSDHLDKLNDLQTAIAEKELIVFHPDSENCVQEAVEALQLIAIDLKRWIAAIQYRLDNPEEEPEQTEPEQTDSDMTIPDAVDVEDINF